MRETIEHLTDLADELLHFARLHPEAYDELCEAAAQIVEAKKRIAKRHQGSVKTRRASRKNATGIS